MLGPEGACQSLAAALSAALPNKMAELITRYQVTAANELDGLTDPIVLSSEPPNTGQPWAAFPVVFVLELNTAPMIPTEQDDNGTWYNVPYKLALTGYGRGYGFDDARRNTRRLILALRELVLAYPQIQVDAVGQTITLDRGSLVEQYGNIATEQQDSIMGASIEGMWHGREYLPFPYPSLGDAADTDFPVQQMP